MKTKCAKNTEQMVRRGNWKTTRGGGNGGKLSGEDKEDKKL